MIELSIIILNYKTKDLTIGCVNSIVEQYKKELDKGSFEIILVDNASQDGSVEAFKKLKVSNLKLVESKENTGFSRGCNLGAKSAKGKFLLFLNSDTVVKDQGFVKMIKFFDDKKNIGVLGGKLKNGDGTNQLSSGKFYTPFNLFLMLFGFNSLIRQSPDVIQKVDWVSGASFMIKKQTFESLRGFDKNIFMYLEDMDLCFRAKKRKLDTYFFPEIMLFHKEGRSSGRSFAILNIYKSTFIFYKKHMSGREIRVARIMLFAKAYVLNIFGKLTKNSYYINTYGQALKLF